MKPVPLIVLFLLSSVVAFPKTKSVTVTPAQVGPVAASRHSSSALVTEPKG